MYTKMWTSSIVGLVSLVMLLTPATSEAQRRGGGRGSWQSSGRGGGYYYNGGRGYYRGWNGGWGIGFGWGYPGYYYPGSYYGYGSRPYYSGYGTYNSDSPQYTYYSNATQSYPGTMPNQLMRANDAGFIVRVPDANAEVWFQDYRTQQRGLVRQFESDNLDPNKTYTFHVRARWSQNGQQMDQTREVIARAGQNLIVDFTNPVREQLPTSTQDAQRQAPLSQ